MEYITKGGFSKIYLLNKDNKHYIVKKILKNKENLNEIKMYKYLNNRNIVKIYDYYIKNNYYNIILEYMNMGDINNIIEHKNIFNILLQITNGIRFIHDNNIIHRDIKPSNILINSNGNIKITDFGIAKKLSKYYNKTFTHIGTKHYMAPEMYNNYGYTYSIDYWSLGCTLYKLLTGNILFNSNNYFELYDMVCCRKVKINVKRPFNYLLKGLVNKNYHKRYNYKHIYIFLRKNYKKRNVVTITKNQETIYSPRLNRLRTPLIISKKPKPVSYNNVILLKLK
jgi:serine/threonine protein kinase